MSAALLQVGYFVLLARLIYLPGTSEGTGAGHDESKSGKERRFDIGDKPEGEQNKAKTLAMLAKDHEMIFAPHFPFPSVGYIEKDGDHFKWAPSE